MSGAFSVSHIKWLLPHVIRGKHIWILKTIRLNSLIIRKALTLLLSLRHYIIILVLVKRLMMFIERVQWFQWWTHIMIATLRWVKLIWDSSILIVHVFIGINHLNTTGSPIRARINHLISCPHYLIVSIILMTLISRSRLLLLLVYYSVSCVQFLQLPLYIWVQSGMIYQICDLLRYNFSLLRQ